MVRGRSSFAAAAIVASLALAPSSTRADVAGINLGAPVWHGVPAEGALVATIGTGAHYVRVNFRLDDWSSPTDATLHGGETWFEVYDHVVDAIVSQGYEVYGLLNDELTTGFSRPYSSTAFEDAYATNALAVIDRYKDRVRVFETINEPNDWAGGSSSRMPADVFARVHARIYDEVKGKHSGDACWDRIQIVTGPLFSFDDNSSSGYFDSVVSSGRSGGKWAALRSSLGHDPIDGVGYHVYVAQGEGSPDSDVNVKGGANLDAMGAVLSKYGISTKFWVSEIGWEVDAAYVTEATQARRLDAAWSTLGARGDVASLQWFTIRDFPGGPFGLFRLAGFTDADKRPSYARFVAQAKSHAPALAAKLAVTLLASVAVGSKVTAHVTARNLGLDAWTESGKVRLGAASGCPSAWATNDWTWDDPGAARGFVKSATDARIFLDPSASIAQGTTTTFDVALTAPSTPGKKRFAVRMVQEGVAWFGSTAWADVDVVAPGSDSGPDASTHDAIFSDSAGDSAADARDASSLDASGGDAGSDGGAVDAGSGSSGGCACRAAAASSFHAPLPVGALATLLAGLLVARRRKRA